MHNQNSNKQPKQKLNSTSSNNPQKKQSKLKPPPQNSDEITKRSYPRYGKHTIRIRNNDDRESNQDDEKYSHESRKRKEGNDPAKITSSLAKSKEGTDPKWIL